MREFVLSQIDSDVRIVSARFEENQIADPKRGRVDAPARAQHFVRRPRRSHVKRVGKYALDESGAVDSAHRRAPEDVRNAHPSIKLAIPISSAGRSSGGRAALVTSPSAAAGRSDTDAGARGPEDS
jgi:hypothetical protein